MHVPTTVDVTTITPRVEAALDALGIEETGAEAVRFVRRYPKSFIHNMKPYII